MAQPWYDYAIPDAGSHAAGDDGDDVDTPDNTPVTLPFGGKVIDAQWYDYGGQVVADVPGTGYSEYAIHLNDIYVQPGQTVPAGTIIGTSGGGVGDKVKHAGKVQPAQSQGWYNGHSTGYHMEYGLFEGDNMAAFNQGWGNHQRQLDPPGVLHDLQQGLEPHWPGTSQPTGVSASPGPVQGTTLGLPGVDPSQWPTQIATSLGFVNPQDALLRLTAGAVGIGGILLAVFVALQPDLSAPVKVAAKAAEAAA